MRLTKRDQRIIQLVAACRLLTAKQIQTALFPIKHDSRCQLRLTLLTRNRYLDTMPGRLVNQPAIYCVTRRSRNAFSFLREIMSDEEIRSQMIASGSIKHLLAINDVRVRVIRSCSDLRLTLTQWSRSEDLLPVLKDDKIIPDAYFRIERDENGQTRTAAFFLELQRANRSKRVIKSKLDQYAKLYNSGRYTKLFGTRALRVLCVFTSEYGTNNNHRISATLELARNQGVAITRCTTLDTITSNGVTGILTSDVWQEPSSEVRLPLYRL